MRKLSPIILALALSPFVQAEPVSEVSPVGKIDGMVSLPVTGMKAVESNGRIVFMSDSGRFVIDGTLYDAWSKKPLTSLEEIREAGNTLDLSRLGLKMDDLNPLTLGEGKKKVVVFVDPRCPHCHELLKQALNVPQPMEQQAVVMFALVNGFMDDVEIVKIIHHICRVQKMKILQYGNSKGSEYSRLQPVFREMHQGNEFASAIERERTRKSQRASPKSERLRASRNIRPIGNG